MQDCAAQCANLRTGGWPSRIPLLTATRTRAGTEISHVAFKNGSSHGSRRYADTAISAPCTALLENTSCSGAGPGAMASQAPTQQTAIPTTAMTTNFFNALNGVQA